MRFHVRIPQLSRLVLALSIAATVAGMGSSLFVQAQEQKQVNLGQFDMLTASSGWILLEGSLLWTSDAGQSWDEISPVMADGEVIQAVEFIAPNIGWVLGSTVNPDGSTNFQLAHTTDHGGTWANRTLSLFEPGEVASYAEKVEMGWLDVQRGWISVKQDSGSNFSIGTLFTTADGGNNWKRFPLPIADNVYFSDAQNGWTVGGPSGDQIFHTQDGGATWNDVRPADIPEDTQAMIYSPFVAEGQGLLVATSKGVENSLRVYALETSSGQWLPIGQEKLDVESGIIALSILDAQNFVAASPGMKFILHMTNGKLDIRENRDGLAVSIVELDVVSPDVGWAKSVASSCSTGFLSDSQSAPISCSSTTRLLRTDNGGITWQEVNLPNVPSLNASAISETTMMSAVSASATTMTMQGQGFDRCEIPTLSQMQTWSGSSPYKAVNLYIGGSSRACANNGLLASFLFQLSQQGWRFIPTWVGPQAPCTGYGSRISSDVAIAFGQGISEANLAVDRLAELGLTSPDKTGSVVYYDIEAYGTNSACRAAVNAFMDGWVSQLHTLGNTAGVYGSTLCNTGLSDFLTIPNMPDVIWPARWYHNLGSGYYDPTATVWNLGSCIPNTVWPNHQRVRQYEGDHNETWGNLTMDIDSNVLDGVVAIPYDYPFVSTITSAEANPTNAADISFTVVFSKSVTGVNNADFSLTRSGVTNASISSVNGSGTTYTVTVNTGSGDGTIRLNVVDNDSIRDAVNNPLGGAGMSNGNLSGPTYTIQKSANTNVTIGNTVQGYYIVPSSPSLNLDYPNTLNGPVKVKSLDGGNIFASQRAVFGSSFNEIMGYPADQFTTEYWFPWYDGVYMATWILVGNPSSSQTAYVDIYIGGVKKNVTPYAILPGENITPLFSGDLNGPVRVVSVTGSGTPTAINIFASERSTYLSSFNEVMGVPFNQFTTEYWFPWYDGVYMNTWILVGNPSSSQTAYVDIYIGGVKKNATPYAIPPSGNITPVFTGAVNGPVRVVSVTGADTPSAINIFCSERSIYAGSFSEVMGMPLDQFTTEYWFLWVDQFDTNNMKTWVLAGNPSSSQTAYVDIYVGGIKQGSTYSIAPNGNITPTFAVTNGPVRVISVTGSGTPTPINIFSSERTLNGNSFNEMMGYPADQLASEYWFTWYDSTYMSTEILIGKP